MKTFTITYFIFGFLITSMYSQNHISPKASYYVIETLEIKRNSKEYNYVIPNVVYVDCDRHSDYLVNSQLADFYMAFYAKTRDGLYINTQRSIISKFDTWEKAELKRRQWIADLNARKANLFLIEDFSVLCDN